MKVKPPKSIKHYDVVREKVFEDNFKQIAKGYDKDRIFDLESSIDWSLSRNPKIFTPIEQNAYYIWKSESLSDHYPQLLIVYKVDSDQCKVFLIDVIEI